MCPHSRTTQSQAGTNSVPTVAVGGYQLELGAKDGIFALFAPQPEQEQAHALDKALRAPESVGETPAIDVLEEVLGDASSIAEHGQRCLRLFTEIAEGSRDPHAISDEIDALLALVGRLDREGKHKEALRLARNLAALLALLLRWLDLVRSLQLALRTARALGDQRAEAWALHELGSLWLAAGEPAAATKHLKEAVGLKEQLGGQGRCVSRHNLDAAQRALADRTSLERLQRRRLFRLVGAASAIVFLAGGGVALGITANSHKPTIDPPAVTPATVPSTTGRTTAATTTPFTPRKTTSQPRKTTSSPPPRTTTEAPPVITEAPPVITEAPPVTTEAPPVTTEAPPVTTEAPPVTTEAPPITTQPSPITIEPSPITIEPSPITIEPSPITD